MTMRTAHTNNPTEPVYDQSPRVGMTYDWNGHTHEIDRPDLSDYHVAVKVRMLTRGDLNHEAVCEMARSRIMGLSKELARVKAQLEKLEDDASELRDPSNM